MDLEKENKKLEEALALSYNDNKNTIGVQQEHTLHKVMKYYLSPNPVYQEILVGKMYADVKIDNHIYEVQTKSFNALRNKLAFFLKEYEVTIVHPMAKNRYFYLMNEFGEVIKEQKSPRHIYPLEVTWELYKIKNFLKDPNLKLKLIMLDMDEYRLKKEAKIYHKGYERENQIPKKILDIYDLNDKISWQNLLLEYQLPSSFTSSEFAGYTHISKKKAVTALNVLTYLEVVIRINKIGNKYIYKINDD